MSANSAASGPTQQPTFAPPPFTPPPPSAPRAEGVPSVVVVYEDTPFELLTFPIDYKVRKRALNVLGGLATLFGGAGIVASTTFDLSNLSLWKLLPVKESMKFGFVFVPSVILALLGIALLFAAARVIPYNDKATWDSLRQKAARLSFKELVDSFGFDRLRNYNLLPLQSLQAKYRAWVADSSPGENLNLYDLQEHGIIGVEECERLNTLLKSAQRALSAGENVEYLRLMEQFHSEAGFVKGRAEKRATFRRELQPLVLRNVLTLHPKLWNLAVDGRLNVADYEKLVDLKARWNSAGNKESEKLKLQAEFERHFKSQLPG